MEKVDLMVLAPHEDDELAIAGPMIYQAVRNGQHVKVVFSTNGDYYPKEGVIRIAEAKKALGVLGVSEKDIIFLGYGDQTQGIHLYNALPNEVIPSYNGTDTTYGNDAAVPHKYTRNHFKNDIKGVLEIYLPDIIVTTDWDNHMDHIALSLMLDECMGELLKGKDGYYPLILKAQAYTGKWEGRADYYSTFNVTEHVNEACGTEWEHPLNRWEDRIRLCVPKECGIGLLRKNILYRAAREYRSQNVDLKAIQFINQDLVFWRRHTEGLLYQADLQATSGNVSYLNDFKCVDCTDIVNDFRNYNQSIWITEEEDTRKEITVELKKPAHLREFHFYENPAKCCQIKNIQIFFENGICTETGELQHDGSKTVVLLPEMEEIKTFSIVIEKWEGSQIGLTELEVYDKLLALEEYQLPLVLWDEKKSYQNEITLGMKAEKLYQLFLRYARGRLWPDKYFLMKRYDFLEITDSSYTFWKAYVRFVLEKVLEKVR